MDKNLTRRERRKFVKEMLDHLSWLKTNDNSERMADKGSMKTGIVHDALMMCFDFAEQNNLSATQLLDWLVVGVAMQSNPDSQTRKDFMTIHKTIDPLSQQDFERRLERKQHEQ